MDDKSSAGRRWLLIGLVAVVVVAGAVFAVNLASPGGSTTTPPPSTTVLHTGGARVEAGAFTCVEVVGEQPDRSCERRGQDFIRRTKLTPEQTAEVTSKSAEVQALFPPLPTQEPTCSTPGGPCRFNVGPIDSAYVASAWSAVFRAGYENAVIRLARADDPFPAGTMVYGIPVGPGCIVGYLSSDNSSGNIVGLLPEGSCLTP